MRRRPPLAWARPWWSETWHQVHPSGRAWCGLRLSRLEATARHRGAKPRTAGACPECVTAYLFNEPVVRPLGRAQDEREDTQLWLSLPA